MFTEVLKCSRWLVALLLLVSASVSAAGEDFLPLPQVDQLPPAGSGTFSIVVIPDTQAYRTQAAKDGQEKKVITNSIFSAHTQWVVDHLADQRIAFVSHVGDIVDRDEPGQWAVARAMMDRLHGRVPYGISVGNHDMTAAGNSSLFQRFFPASRFEDFPWYGGTFAGHDGKPEISGNNANSYQLFSAGGMDFVFLHLECNAPDDVLEWADTVLEQHADRRALITSHMGLGPQAKPEKSRDYFDAPKGRMQWTKRHGERGNTPQQMWEKCFRRHANVFLIQSGDQSRTQARAQAVTGDAGNRVNEFLCDYSTGWLRLYRFHPAQDMVEAWTFNPATGALCERSRYVPDRQAHLFRFSYPMTGPAAAGD
ncbi:MAG: metallophosphoesterase [Planctomycetaceae bacterium]|nr:metallophosphoesterase [Planctomycetaceae bacterium]